MNVAVVGAGISGLSFAYRFQKLAKNQNKLHTLTIFEASARVGGIIETVFQDGFLLEMGPDSFLSEKPWATQLSRELGIDSELINTQNENRKMSVARGSKLLPVPQGFYLIAPTDIRAFLMSPIFSPSEKLRMLKETNIPKKESDEDESVAAFITRRFGEAALHKMGQPMVAGIYTGDPAILSAKSVLPRFVEYEKTHGSVLKGLSQKIQASGPRYGLFQSYKKGMQTLTDALVEQFDLSQIKLNSEITKISFEAQDKKWKIEFKNKEAQFFDAVVLTTGAGKSAELLKSSDAALRTALSQISNESVATLNLAYPKSAMGHALTGFGFVVPKTENRSLIACTFVHQKYERRAPDTHALLRVFIGGAFGKEIFAKSDEEILKHVRQDLKELLGIQTEPLFTVIRRYPGAMVQYAVGHEERVKRIKELTQNQPRLSLIGSSYSGVGIPDCIKEAEAAASELMDQLKF